MGLVMCMVMRPPTAYMQKRDIFPSFPLFDITPILLIFLRNTSDHISATFPASHFLQMLCKTFTTSMHPLQHLHLLRFTFASFILSKLFAYVVWTFTVNRLLSFHHQKNLLTTDISDPHSHTFMHMSEKGYTWPPVTSPLTYMLLDSYPSAVYLLIGSCLSIESPANVRSPSQAWSRVSKL